MTHALDDARQLVSEADRLVVFSGAGMSAESGVPTFRGLDGHWKNFRPEQLATPFAFQADPRLVWEWYQWRRERIGSCLPNAGHRAVAEAQLRRGSDVSVLTQNVDGLHTKAVLDLGAPPTTDILELHGSIFRVRCSMCDYERHDRSEIDASEVATLPRCPQCQALLRPGVVWFGEALDEDVIERSFSAAAEAEVCLVVGTSGVVEPAASLPRQTAAHGGKVIEINPEPTPLSTLATVAVRAPSAQVLPTLLGVPS